MERNDIQEIVRAVTAEVCGRDCRLDQRIKEDCGLDSLSLVAVIVGIEEKAGIVFDDGDLDPAKLITVEDLVELTWKNS